jgi:hypothetical protein
MRFTIKRNHFRKIRSGYTAFLVFFAAFAADNAPGAGEIPPFRIQFMLQR